MSSVGVVLRDAGGAATYGDLRRTHSRRAIAAAVGAGEIQRLRRGRYAVAGLERAPAVAVRLNGVLSHLSAARSYGWAVRDEPDRPWVIVPRGRHVTAGDREVAHVIRADLTDSEHHAGRTDALRTVLDCARALPFDAALAVADSALRAEDVDVADLWAAGDRAAGPGAPRVRRVARAADGRAANPMESVLRAITLDVPEFTFIPQLRIADSGLWATVDLGDPEARVVLEAEGFAAHQSRRDLLRDSRRYTELVAWGWEVLRFSWEDVMLRPEWARWAIRAVAIRRGGGRVPAPPRWVLGR